jgi:hypothetical protein
VEVDHPRNKMVILPKIEWEKRLEEIEKLQVQLMVSRMDTIINSHAKKYTSAEVDAMLKEVLSG